jgi:predicted amidophosphoribosyltransferase
MSTEPQRTCPTCGNEISAAVEFCPVCKAQAFTRSRQDQTLAERPNIFEKL